MDTASGRVFPARHRRLRTQIIATVRQAAARQLEPGISAQVIEIVGVFVAAGDRKNAGAQNVVDAVRHQSRIAPVCDLARQRLRSSNTPPSEVIRPPSKAPTSFLRPTAEKLNGKIISSDMAGVARACA